MRVAFDNREALVYGAPLGLIKRLDERTAYRVPGAHFSPLFRSGRWDGKEHLILKRKTHHRVPIGLLGDLLIVASAEGVEVEQEDRRRLPAERRVETTWDPAYSVRSYQADGVAALLADRGILTGKGLWDVPTRGGKTVMVARAIHELAVASLVLVQSEMVMDQTVRLFEVVLGVGVGRIGAGQRDPRPITVASCQSLARNAGEEWVRDLLSAFDFVAFDEVHHLGTGKTWRGLLESIDAYYKVGVSATLFLGSAKEVPKGTIRVRSVTGPVLYGLTPSDLIRLGHLIQPQVELVRVEGPAVLAEEWGDVYQFGVVAHAQRNALVADAALRHHRAGLQVLVVADRIEHTDALAELCRVRGLRTGVITGPTDRPTRRRLVEEYSARRLDVLVGTVFGEGVDIPAIEAVVNAEGGKSKIAAMQRFRCLTPSGGKDTAILTDFMDLHHKVLAKHSQERLKTYKEHELFRLRVVQ